jgi:uncharacterized protein (DUF433 family)
MVLAIGAEPTPLRTDAQGVVRVGDTRVTLDTVAAAFREGATPEEIVQRYPTLRLGDVYAVISYYLRHSLEVETYLRAQRESADALRGEIEAHFDPTGIRDRLLARRNNTPRR